MKGKCRCLISQDPLFYRGFIYDYEVMKVHPDEIAPKSFLLSLYNQCIAAITAETFYANFIDVVIENRDLQINRIIK